MADESNGTKNASGPPPATGIFKPRFMEVEKSVDVDEVFRRARQIAGGERLEETANPDTNTVEGQRCVAIVTPGRLIMCDPCPEPNSVPEEQVADIRSILPPDPPLAISVISYTNIEALTTDTDMTRTIPFRGILNGWAYLGHNVMVFEGHPSAFESGVRDCDVLLIDSGMLAFIQFNWADVACRVMRPGGRIFIHDRDTYTLSIVTNNAAGKRSTSQLEADYAELLLRFLIRSSRSTVDITSGEVLPDLADLLKTELDWVAKLTEEREKLNTTIIDVFLARAGFRWYLPFKKSGTLEAATAADDGTIISWKFTITLRKTSEGKRQIQIER